ncbi:MAG: hypothetical protein ACI4QD_01865 [Kiritimatiellia bacterium]
MPRLSPFACFAQAWKSCNGHWGLITLMLIVYGIISLIGLVLGRGVYNLLLAPVFDFTLSILFLKLVRNGTISPGGLFQRFRTISLYWQTLRTVLLIGVRAIAWGLAVVLLALVACLILEIGLSGFSLGIGEACNLLSGCILLPRPRLPLVPVILASALSLTACWIAYIYRFAPLAINDLGPDGRARDALRKSRDIVMENLGRLFLLDCFYLILCVSFFGVILFGCYLGTPRTEMLVSLPPALFETLPDTLVSSSTIAKWVLALFCFSLSYYFFLDPLYKTALAIFYDARRAELDASSGMRGDKAATC